MQRRFAAVRVFHSLNQRRILKELAGLDCVVNPRCVHSNYPARTDIQMADLTVSHLPGPQSDISSRSFYQSMRTGRIPFIEVRRVCESNRVAISRRRVAKTVKHYQDQRSVLQSRQIRSFPLDN